MILPLFVAVNFIFRDFFDIILSRIAENMQRKKFKKIKLNLFQKVKFDPESAETFALVLIGALVFGAAFFAGGWIMAIPNRETAGITGSERVLAAKDQEYENMADPEENTFPEESRISGAMSEAADLIENLAIKKARAEAAAKKLAAEKALRRSAPVLSGPTKKASQWTSGLHWKQRPSGERRSDSH